MRDGGRAAAAGGSGGGGRATTSANKFKVVGLHPHACGNITD